MFDPADSVYLGSFLSAAPTQYVQFSEAGITLKSGSATIVVGSDGTVKINGIDFSTHVHTGVVVGAADSGPPLV